MVYKFDMNWGVPLYIELFMKVTEWDETDSELDYTELVGLLQDWGQESPHMSKKE